VLRAVGEAWELVLGGSTDRTDLDTSALKAANKWKAINEVFVNPVRRTAPARDLMKVCDSHTRTRSRPSPLTARFRARSRVLCSLRSQAYTFRTRSTYARLFENGDDVDLPAHAVGDGALSSHFATFRSLYVKFET
jgi:hypothetical protein